MKHSFSCLIFGAVFLGIFFAQGRISAQEAEAKISGFRFYLTDENGRQKGIVNGFKADFTSPEEIRITDASAELTDISTYPVIIQTPLCIFMKNRAEIVSQMPVLIKSMGVEINGIGLAWSFEKKKITIEKEVIVDVAKNVQKQFKKE